ncbi:penicillin-binding protein 1A [Pseudonocardia sulfidoxydans NBRC 16205]|uniref:Penicillin-binding protein 1A n=2 Tax=Pseudonocardia sulfidoxydans TaxID=54011 RepID=A0A511DAN9_9PSEU|nr:transglycosylase domain-containing protein [Pseudonocardia sulfidoxydans]GEL21875.1 penicillin-binding protein 1A [Pseudonocardia sulfidoxydans NBRC 16205]
MRTRATDTGPRRVTAESSDGADTATRAGKRRASRRRGFAETLRGGFRRSSSQHLRALSTDERRALRRRRIKWSIIGGAAAVVLAPVLLFVVGYLIFSVPTPDEAVNNQVALVSYDDGTQLARLVPEQGNRVKVPIDRIPVQVRQAVLAAEDRSFYSNPGFDLTGILRAAWNQVRGGAGGGSTISQQYVKKTLVGDEATLFRKWKEMIVSVKINQERSKDEILGDYLNAIYFGRGAYGIQAASQAYFGKNVEQLTAADGALLAGVIQSPSRWDPAIDPAMSLQRWQFVIDGMVAQGWLTPAEKAQARFPETVARKVVGGGAPADSRGHVVNAVRDELGALGITDQEFSQEGLRITTTIDPRRQREAVDAAHAGLAGQPDNLRSAVVAVDPSTGGITAYYGGDNGVGLDYAKVRKQAGSTFKPFVVLAGLLQDPPIGLGEVFDGNAVPGLRNSDGADCDRCDLKQAMTISNNVVFNSLSKKVGAQKVADAARAAGITSPLTDPDERIALGNKEVTPLELASAYATIAGGGVYRVPHMISEVVTSDGRVLYEAQPSDGERRFPERVARNVTEAMLDVAGNDGLSLPGVRQVAAKTGTVQSHVDGQNNDAWMSGFTPEVAATVWIGTDMNTPIRTADGTPISGGSVPGSVWHDFMTGVAKQDPPPTFAPYHAIGEPPSDMPPGVDPDASVAPSTPASPTAPPTSTIAPTTVPTGVSGVPTTAPPDPRAAGGAPAEPPGPPGPSAPPVTTTAQSTCTLANPCG